MRSASDGSWAAFFDRTSSGGYAILLGICLVAWKCAFEKTICLSSMEAEICFASRACKEIVWLQRLASGLIGKIDATLFVDNKATIDASRNPVSSQRVKHIDIKNLYVRQCVARGHITLKYIPTAENPADCLTKPATLKLLQVLSKFCSLSSL